MNSSAIGRPGKTEYAPDYETYITLVGGDDIVAALRGQMIATQKILAEISEEKSLFCYAEDKWSIRELVGHMIDAERIMAYRALRFARNDKTALAGFEQNDYVENAGSDAVRLTDLATEFAAVRDATILMFQNFSENAWTRAGIANENQVSVRALAYIIAGHELHHIGILRERYLDFGF